MEGHLKLACCGQPRTCMPRKRGIRSGHRREFRVVRASALRKLRRSKVDLSLNELIVLAHQIRADLERITGAMVDMDKRHTQEIQQRDLQLAEKRGTLTALNTRGSRLGPGRSELLDPKILHKVQPFDGQRTSWKTFEFQWRACLIAQDRKYRELLEKSTTPTKDVRNGDLDLENQELSMQLYFALVLVMPRESVGELIVRNVKQGEGAVAWRQILEEYASTEPGNVLAMLSKLGDLRFPQGSDIVVGINKMEEDMTRYQKMAGENLSDTIKRGILMKALTNEAELQTEARVSQQHTPQHVREDADVSFDGRAGSARTDGGRSDGDWSRRQERQEGHRQERKR